MGHKRTSLSSDQRCPLHPKADINHHLFSAVVIALIRLFWFGGPDEIRPSTPLAWLATVSSCFDYLISQVALWLVISAARPPTVS